MGEECLPPFRERHPDWREFTTPLGGGKWLLDLPEAARRQLIGAGVAGERIGAPGPLHVFRVGAVLLLPPRRVAHRAAVVGDMDGGVRKAWRRLGSDTR